MSNYYRLIPGYDDETALIAQIESETRRLWGQPNTVVRYTANDLVDDLRAGRQVPDDIAEANERANADGRNRAAALQMLKDAKTLAKTRQIQLVIDGHQPAFDKLSADMDGLMAAVRKTAQALGGATTFEGAYDAGVPDAWKASREQIQQYRDLRSAQTELTHAVLGSEHTWKIYEVGFVRNSLEQHDGWLAKRQSAAAACFNGRSNPGFVKSYAQWLRDGGRNRWHASKSVFPEKMADPMTGAVTKADPWAHLIWLATEAEAWVPYPGTALKAYELAADAVAEPTVSGVARRRESRAAYFELIGRKPRLPFEKHDPNAPTDRLPSKERYTIGGKSLSFAENASAHLFG